MSKDEIIAAVREYARKLGRTPSFSELLKNTRIRRHRVVREFGGYAKALRACGLRISGAGYPAEMRDLFADWAGIVRRLKRIPNTPDYKSHSRYSPGPLTTRCGCWEKVPDVLWKYAEANGLAGQWRDVGKMVAVYQEQCRRERWGYPLVNRPRLLPDRPVVGPPLRPAALAHGPVNEAGVIFLFGMMADRLGFMVTQIQNEFPDCEAMRQVARERWQRVHVEFEYESRNFLRHGHRPEECDMIVCWSHNWPECPLDVIELKTVLQGERGGPPFSDRAAIPRVSVARSSKKSPAPTPGMPAATGPGCS